MYSRCIAIVSANIKDNFEARLGRTAVSQGNTGKSKNVQFPAGGRLPEDLQVFHRLQCLITGHEWPPVMKGGGCNDAVRRILMRKEGVVG